MEPQLFGPPASINACCRKVTSSMLWTVMMLLQETWIGKQEYLKPLKEKQSRVRIIVVWCICACDIQVLKVIMLNDWQFPQLHTGHTLAQSHGN